MFGKINSRLSSFRLYRNWNEQDVATELSLKLEEYQLLESGEEKITEEIAQKLSDLYRVPLQFFLENERGTHFSVIYSHNTFQASNGYVHNLYLDNDKAIAIITATKDEEIQFLKQEIAYMREQNLKLIGLIERSRTNKN